MPELVDVFTAARAERKRLEKAGRICPLVFHRDGKAIRHFRRAWLTAAKDAGVPGAIVHDLRRTAVRNLVRAGNSEKVAMDVTGHLTRDVFDRYNITSDSDRERAAKLLTEHVMGAERGGNAVMESSAAEQPA